MNLDVDSTMDYCLPYVLKVIVDAGLVVSNTSVDSKAAGSGRGPYSTGS